MKSWKRHTQEPAASWGRLCNKMERWMSEEKHRKTRSAQRRGLSALELEVFEGWAPGPKEVQVATRLRRCSNPACTKLERRVGEFKLCARCKTTWYCGPECQVSPLLGCADH